MGGGARLGDAERRLLRHDVRTSLNHIAGYAGILRQDAADAGLADISESYGRIGSDALSLKDSALPCFLSPEEGGPPAEERAGLEREAYGLLFDIIALVQSLRRKVEKDGRFGPDTDKILAAANRVIELFEELLRGYGGGPGPTRAATGGTGVEAGRPGPPSRLDTDDLPRAERTGRILVVDDDQFNRELLARHLERQGHVVCAARDGAQALGLLREAPFDVVVLDVMMPGMNGYQLLERLRDDPALKELRVIVVSALEDTQSIARCIQLGAEDYLPREFEPVILRARIESCLEKKKLKEQEALWLAAVTETERRLRAELQEGAAYVRSLLPERISLPGLRSDWLYIPSLSLGGDVFGYHGIAEAGAEGAGLPGAAPGPDDGRLAIYLLDVSGHGIQAALYSVTLMNLLKTQALAEADFGDPASVLLRLNASFRMEEQNNLIFTAWYGVWDPATRELRYSSAGSPPAFLVMPDGETAALATEGTVVGADADSRYVAASVQVPRDSGLYLFSDGIYEVRLREGGMLGLEAFQRVLSSGARRAGLPGPEGRRFLPALVEEILGLAATRRFEDDVSLVELRL